MLAWLSYSEVGVTYLHQQINFFLKELGLLYQEFAKGKLEVEKFKKIEKSWKETIFEGGIGKYHSLKKMQSLRVLADFKWCCFKVTREMNYVEENVIL